MTAKVRINNGKLMFYCFGCKGNHMIPIDGSRGWVFDGNIVCPSVSPSLLTRGVEPVTDEQYARIVQGEKIEPKQTVCHLFVREGNIEYLNDCTHEYKGKTVEMRDWNVMG